jgi:membrane fusion protein, multidrug efflux system
VKLGEDVGANISIDSGLTAGEQIIVEGIQGIRRGAAVLASPMPPEPRR